MQYTCSNDFRGNMHSFLALLLDTLECVEELNNLIFTNVIYNNMYKAVNLR